MEQRNRAWRRSQTIRIQSNRQKTWAKIHNFEWAKEPKNFGKFKKNNFSCGCSMCKPWKHGRSDNYSDSKK